MLLTAMGKAALAGASSDSRQSLIETVINRAVMNLDSI